MGSPSINRVLIFSLAVGALAWVMLWLSTSPRAGWDSLVYHKYAFEYAGLRGNEQDELSWEIYARYGLTEGVLYVTEALDGEPWNFNLAPERERWGLLYRMRPAYPALVAVAYPLLGAGAPMAVSAFAVVLFVAATSVGLFMLAGLRVAVIATGLGIFNVLLTGWLVILTPDGLAISLWAVALTAGALWIEQRKLVWLAVVGMAVLAICLTRPIGLLTPLVFGLCALGAGMVRAPEWRPFVAAMIVAAVPAVAVSVFFSVAGFPSFWDLLQDLPTRHFTKPDVENPLGWILNADLGLLTRTMPVGLLARPLVLSALIGGIAGLLLARRWWAMPFLAAIPIVVLSFLLHPIGSELDRTLAPAWISIHTGLALFAVGGLIRWRSRVLEFADRFTQPGTKVEQP